MSKCKVCAAAPGFYTPPHNPDLGMRFHSHTEFDVTYGCVVHKIVADTGKDTVIMFCQNDERSRATSQRLWEQDKTKTLTRDLLRKRGFRV